MGLRLGVAGAALGLLLALCAGVWFHGRDTGREEIRRDWAQEAKRVAVEIARRDRANRDLETKHRKRVEEITSAYQKDQAEQAAELDRALADLRGDNRRLRQRLRGCPATGGADPDPAAGSGADGTAPTGLSRQDEEFLVRLSAEADQVALRLTHLQAYVRGLPDHCGG